MIDQDTAPQEQPGEGENIIDSVRELIEMMGQSDIGELDLKTKDFKISLRTEAVAIATGTPVVTMPNYTSAQAPLDATGSASIQSSDAGSTSADAEPAQVSGHVVSSPMIGTFYAASAPGEPAYVQVGDEVETGQVIGIIEAMKIMNEITADKSGVIVEILVENAEPVEYGSPLVRISSSLMLD